MPPHLIFALSHAEQAIAASGVPYTIFRPTYFMETLPRQIRGRRAVVLGRQRRPFHLLAAADFAGMVSRSLSTPEAGGKHLDVHGPQAFTIPGRAADLLRAGGSWHPRRDDAAMVHDDSRSDSPARRAPRHPRTDARPTGIRRAGRSHRGKPTTRRTIDHACRMVRTADALAQLH